DADLAALAPNRGAVLLECLELAREFLGRAGPVALVRITRHQPQRALLAGASDQDRGAAGLYRRRYVQRLVRAVVAPVERRAFAAQHAADDLERLVEPRQALADRREIEAIALVLGLEPARADPEDRAAARHDVERRDDLREVGGIPVGVAGDERAEPPARARR